jgi:hypothetical protein
MSINLQNLKFAEKVIAAEIKKADADGQKLETKSYPINFVCQFEGTLAKHPEKSRSVNYPKADVISTTLKLLMGYLIKNHGFDSAQLGELVAGIVNKVSNDPNECRGKVDSAVEAALDKALKEGKAKFQLATPKTTVAGITQAVGEVRVPTAEKFGTRELSEILNQL